MQGEPRSPRLTEDRLVALCTLTINSWAGPIPTPGVYLKSVRGRTAYEIVTFSPARPGAASFGRVRCRRLPPSEIPEGATIFEWQWAKR